MKRTLLSFLVLLTVAKLRAQTEPVPEDISTQLTRPSVVDELNKESSSFMGDPDPLDPLPVKKESLKEDEEPVLQDIRDVIDAPAPKKLVEKPPKALKAVPSVGTSTSSSTDFSTRLVRSKKSSAKKIKQSSSHKSKTSNRDSDDPDARIEARFHQLYERLNSTPTSAEAWSAVADGRKAEVYEVQQGDTLYTISKTLFGDPNFWPKIWALNRQGITNPHQINPGLKIYFYPGSADDIPSLSVGGEANNSALSANEDHLGAGNQEKSSRTRLSDSSSNYPAAIPNSFPLYRNEDYFLSPPVLKVELENLTVPAQTYNNDIILADRIVASEVEVPVAALSQQRCKENLLIKNVKISSQPMGDYTILESAFPVKAKDGMIYPYRIIGSARATSENGIRVINCNRGLTTTSIFVQTNLLPQIRTGRSSNQSNATLIGGPDVNEQMLFTFQQYAYVDMGSRGGTPGQILDIKSQVTDSVHGQLKVIDTFGSYAVGVITNISDTISEGDTLITSQ